MRRERAEGVSRAAALKCQQLNNSFLILGQALILSVILEYMLLVALYESWFYPIVLILGVPLGITGALWALFVTHNTLNIFSIIGLIMAVGLVAKTGILLVDFTNTLRNAAWAARRHWRRPPGCG